MEPVESDKGKDSSDGSNKSNSGEEISSSGEVADVSTEAEESTEEEKDWCKSSKGENSGNEDRWALLGDSKLVLNDGLSGQRSRSSSDFFGSAGGSNNLDGVGDGPGDRVLDESIANNDSKGVLTVLGAELRLAGLINGDDYGVDLVLVGGGNENGLMSSLGIGKAEEGLLSNEGTGGGTSSVSINELVHLQW